MARIPTTTATPLHALAPFVIAAAVFLTFSPSLESDFVAWDDNLFITQNPYYRGLSPAHLKWMFTTSLETNSNYIPLTWLTYGLDYVIWGMDPRGYHLTNVILHAGTAVALLYVILCLLGRIPWAAGSPLALPSAVIGTLFFAVHPLRVESVAWVSARKDVLSGFFYVLTILIYLRAQQRGGSARRAWLLASWAAFVLCLGAKSWGVTLPVVLLLLDAHPLGRLTDPVTRRQAFWEKVPFAALSAADAAVALLGSARVRAVHPLEAYGLGGRMLQAAYGFCFYLWKTVVPISLSPLYPLGAGIDPADPRGLVCVAAVLGVITVVALTWRRLPWMAPLWGAYTVTVLPFLGFVQTGPQLVADRYMYLASLPWSAALAASLCWLDRRHGRQAILTALAGVSIAALGALTFQQTTVWKDSESLWTHALEVDPSSSVAYTNRAWYRQRTGDVDGALADLDRAIEANPRDAAAYNNRGVLRRNRGDVAGAAEDFRAGLRFASPHTRWYGYLKKNLAALGAAPSGASP